MDYLALMLRWWERWLRQVSNGVDAEPAATVFVQNGRGWHAYHEWPPSDATERVLYLGHGESLADEPDTRTETIEYVGDPTVGLGAGAWDPTGSALALPADQGPDDGRSITFNSKPLEGDLELVGSPVVSLSLVLERGPEVHLVAKLCDVDPIGASSLITTGWLKYADGNSRSGTHRPVQEVTECEIQLWATSYLVPAGHRLRLSVSCADFPRLWPTRENPVIHVRVGGIVGSAALRFLVNSRREPTPEAEPPMPSSGEITEPLKIESAPCWTIEREFHDEHVEVSAGLHLATWTPDRDGRFEINRLARIKVSRKRPDLATATGHARIAIDTPLGRSIRIEATSRRTQTGLRISARVRLDNELVFERRWSRRYL